MPIGHIKSFNVIGDYRKLSENMGVALGRLSKAMQKILEIEWDPEKGTFKPAQIIYGKCETPENTQEHLHYKLVPFSGDVAQAFPTDAGWVKKEIYNDNNEKYVKAKPVKKGNLLRKDLNS